MRFNHPGTRKRIYLDTMRNLAYHLYRAWAEDLNDISKEQQERKAKELEEKRKKDQEEAEKAAKRIPAEEVLDTFRSMW